jgi:hypothetical protein
MLRHYKKSEKRKKEGTMNRAPTGEIGKPGNALCRGVPPAGFFVRMAALI